MEIKTVGIDKAYLREQYTLIDLLIKAECFVLNKNWILNIIMIIFTFVPCTLTLSKFCLFTN